MRSAEIAIVSNTTPSEKKKVIFKRISFKPLNENNWKDLEELFGLRGACGGCWCMYWRLKRSEYEKNKGAGNKGKMKQLVKQEMLNGVLMYLGREVAGWCSFGPRESFPLLENSRVLAAVDDQPVWSIICFFMAKEFRRQGLSVPFLKYVMSYCKNKGAKIIEAYPIHADSKDYPVVFAHVGFHSSFKKVGFKEVVRRSLTRPVMRFVLTD